MSYRAEEGAAREHLASEQRALEGLRATRDRLTRELADLETLQKDLDVEIATRRGAMLNGRGYVRVAVLMLVMLAAGALEGWALTIGRTEGWIVRGTVISLWALGAWRAIRLQKLGKKQLEEHDARMAARKAVPETRVAEPEPEVERDTDTADEAAARDRHGRDHLA